MDQYGLSFQDDADKITRRALEAGFIKFKHSQAKTVQGLVRSVMKDFRIQRIKLFWEQAEKETINSWDEIRSEYWESKTMIHRQKIPCEGTWWAIKTLLKASKNSIYTIEYTPGTIIIDISYTEDEINQRDITNKIRQDIAISTKSIIKLITEANRQIDTANDYIKSKLTNDLSERFNLAEQTSKIAKEL